ncbi:hypothetical protein KDK77_00425 [bacterium]|nr:hypothetical protein [bacterium]
MIAEILSGAKLLGSASSILGKLNEKLQNGTSSESISKEDFESIMADAIKKLKEESSDDTIPEPEKIGLDSLFKFLDVNKDGALNQGEFERMKILINYARFQVK